MIGVGEVDDDDLVLFPDFLSYSDKVVRLKRQGLREERVPLDG